MKELHFGLVFSAVFLTICLSLFGMFYFFFQITFIPSFRENLLSVCPAAICSKGKSFVINEQWISIITKAIIKHSVLPSEKKGVLRIIQPEGESKGRKGSRLEFRWHRLGIIHDKPGQWCRSKNDADNKLWNRGRRSKSWRYPRHFHKAVIAGWKPGK